MKKIKTLMMLAFAFASLGIYAQYPATSDVLEFQNRKIDVAPFLMAFLSLSSGSLMMDQNSFPQVGGRVSYAVD